MSQDSFVHLQSWPMLSTEIIVGMEKAVLAFKIATLWDENILHAFTLGMAILI